MNTCSHYYDSQFGTLYLETNDQFVVKVLWDNHRTAAISPPNAIMLRLIAQLDDYFAARRFSFDLPLNLSGTAFQQQVWRNLAQIPWGDTRSYKQVADEINSKAVRAVGSACAVNRFHVVIPCHRVVPSQGGVGNYAAGAALKIKLIQFEQTHK